MVRLEFPEFAQLPGDLQTVIFDYIHDKRDPIAVNAHKLEDLDKISNNQVVKRKEVLKRWAELRLVCHRWSQWFSVGAIRKFSGRLHKLAKSRLIEGMTGLVDLEIYIPYRGWEAEPEDLKRLAATIPTSVRHLDCCSAKFLQLLPRKTARNLQTVNLSCKASDPRILQTLKSVLRTFGGRLKHLKVLYSSITQKQARIWEEALRDSHLEELTLREQNYHCFLDFKIPATIKRLNIKGFSSTFSRVLLPACNTLEVLNAPSCVIGIDINNMPIFPALKDVHLKGVANTDYLLSTYWPNLERLVIDMPAVLNFPSNLRSLTITFHEISDFELDLSSLPHSIEEFTFKSSSWGVTKVRSPQVMMKHLRKLIINSRGMYLPGGFFNSMPVLEELDLGYDRISDFEGIELEELLPLCHTLIDFKLQVNGDDEDKQNVLYQFSRLKRLHLTCTGRGAYTLGRLPQSLEELELSGNFIKSNQMEHLPNLRIFTTTTPSAQLAIGVFQNASILKSFTVYLKEPGSLEEFLNGQNETTFQNLATFQVVADKVSSKNIYKILEIFPNIKLLHAVQSNREALDEISVFPLQLLSFLKNNPTLGLYLETVSVWLQPWVVREWSNESRAAWNELRNMGIEIK